MSTYPLCGWPCVLCLFGSASAVTAVQSAFATREGRARHACRLLVSVFRCKRLLCGDL